MVNGPSKIMALTVIVKFYHSSKLFVFITLCTSHILDFLKRKESLKALLYLTNKEAQAVYYTVIKHDGHLRTRGKCRKHEPQASVFYISRVFPNDRSVLSHCNTRLRLLHLL